MIPKAIQKLKRIDRAVGRLGGPSRASLPGAPRPDRAGRRERKGVGAFADFIARVNPGLLVFEHVPRMAAVLQRVADGKLRRVLIVMPPRYFKSECVSRLFAAYFLLRYPERKVGLASYGASLAWELSEEARNNFQADGGALRRTTAAKRRWRSKAGGEMWADGVGGALLGRGYHLGIVDDPIDPMEAHSATYQARFKKWWAEKFLSRQEPGAAIVFVMQRLGPDDPVDYLFRREVGEGQGIERAPEGWHVVCFDEVKSAEPLWRMGTGETPTSPLFGPAGPMGLPPTCSLEPDDRALGEVLAPTRFSPEAVTMLQQSAGPFARAAQRQQRPSAPTGDFWRGAWFGEYDDLPADAEAGGKDWDTAYTANEGNSASAFVESYRGRDGTIYVHDCGWEWYEFPGLVAWMRRTGGPHYVEDKAAGKSAAQTLRAEGIPVTEVSVTGGDKLARAQSVQPAVSGPLDEHGQQVGPGRVKVRRAAREKLLSGPRQGLLTVTAERLRAGGPDLDLNDAFVQAVNRHTHNEPQIF